MIWNELSSAPVASGYQVQIETSGTSESDPRADLGDCLPKIGMKGPAGAGVGPRAEPTDQASGGDRAPYRGSWMPCWTARLRPMW